LADVAPVRVHAIAWYTRSARRASRRLSSCLLHALDGHYFVGSGHIVAGVVSPRSSSEGSQSPASRHFFGAASTPNAGRRSSEHAEIRPRLPKIRCSQRNPFEDKTRIKDNGYRSGIEITDLAERAEEVPNTQSYAASGPKDAEVERSRSSGLRKQDE
jgi:hypothetical protein